MSNKLHLKLFSLIIFILLALPSYSKAAGEELAVPDELKPLSFQEALDKGAKEKKPTMVYFWADWCPSCRYFNSQVLPDRDILKTLDSSFAVVSVNTGSDTLELTKKWGIRSVPSFVFLDQAGDPISVLPGAVDADTFVLVLNYISSGSYANMEFDQYAQSLIENK
ncbi:MAG: thioredoxin fold domain-containing protein [Deltaproteobacteria bacterium]|jgi:thioredoxin-related protein|nr:thioredoxin fold domain-containing protein [Deltaproteobacteria bacterium]